MNRRLLIVDDESIVANDIAECLTHMGCDVVGHALSGADAIAKAGAYRPDLIMMDITLQGPMDGVEAATIIRERYDIPCIFLTAYSDSVVLSRAKKAAPAGYMVKPFEEAGLRSAVEIALYKVDLERDLSQQRELLATTLHSISDAVVATDEQGIIRLINPVAESMTGWTAAEAIGTSVDKVVVLYDENEQSHVANLVQRVLRERGAVSIDRGRIIWHRSGSLRPVTETACPIFNNRGELTGAVLTVRDATERRAAERASDEEQQRLEELVLARTVEIRQTNEQLTAEVEERRRAQNAVARQVLIEQFLAGLSAFFLKASEEEGSQIIDQALAGIGTFLRADRCYLVEWCTADSVHTTRTWCAPNVAPLSQEDTVLQVSDLPPTHEDPQSHMSWISASIAGNVAPAVFPRIVEARGAASLLWMRPSSSRLKLFSIGVDSVPRRRDWGEDELRFLNLAVDIVATQMERNAIVGEKARLHSQLQQSMKMEAVGKLSGGIAHDFNNMLLPVIGYSDMLLTRMHPDDPSVLQVQEIKKAAERAARLTKQLLAFSRKQVAKKSIFDLNESLTGMGRMLERIIGEDIALTMQLASPGAVVIRADQGQLEQILMNLVINGRDAILLSGMTGGSIVIRSMLVDASRHPVPLIGGTASAGSFAVLSVTDTGSGIPAEIQERIFEPFFSTKGTEGTGLGLSVIYGIIQEHGGGIYLDSAPGRGTTFHVFLPAMSAGTACPAPAQPAASKDGFRGNGQRVLLIEDEDVVIRMVRTALSQNGYVVTTAACASEALQRFKEAEGAFEMVFSDAVLPDGNGLQLLDTFLTTNPGIRALLSSGYTDKSALLEMAQQRRISFLAKPYSLSTLFQTVAEVMADQNTHLLT